jgi:thiol-disulfide isomerase/thioredoxin
MELKTRIILNRVVLWITAAVLLFASATKYIMIMNEPILSKSFWQSREFFIISVVLTAGLGIWLICGMFRKAAWLLAILAFAVFILDSIYRIIIGSASCGCFGRVEVNPWITLLAINIPIMALLLLFRPINEKLLPPPWPRANHFFGTAVPTFMLLAVIVFSSLNYAPPTENDRYKVIDHQAWIGEEFEMLEQIDVADSLREGLSVILFYHNDCPNCREAIPVYSEFCEQLVGSGTNVAFIEMPPYGDPAQSPVPVDSQCITGELDDTKKWYAASPLLVVTENGIVIKSWESEVPMDFDTLMESVFE